MLATEWKLTLLSAWSFSLRSLSVSYESVCWLEFLHGLGGVVDEGKAGALPTTVLCSKAEYGDLVLGRFVQFTQLAAELIFGDIWAGRVEDVAVSDGS